MKATKKESGLIQFAVVRTMSEPKYLVAHLAVHHAGKLIATSDTPVFAQKKGNTFYFSISVEDIAESKLGGESITQQSPSNKHENIPLNLRACFAEHGSLCTPR